MRRSHYVSEWCDYYFHSRRCITNMTFNELQKWSQRHDYDDDKGLQKRARHHKLLSYSFATSSRSLIIIVAVLRSVENLISLTDSFLCALSLLIEWHNRKIFKRTCGIKRDSIIQFIIRRISGVGVWCDDAGRVILPPLVLFELGTGMAGEKSKQARQVKGLYLLPASRYQFGDWQKRGYIISYLRIC